MDIEKSNIFLIGLMGAGKSTVGKLIARKLERRFIDSDHALEERCGVKIPTIFEMEGEAGFRKREAQIIDELTREQSIVLATGGGAVLLPEKRGSAPSRSTPVRHFARAPACFTPSSAKAPCSMSMATSWRSISKALGGSG